MNKPTLHSDTRLGNNGFTGRKPLATKPHHVAPLDERRRCEAEASLFVGAPLQLAKGNPGSTGGRQQSTSKTAKTTTATTESKNSRKKKDEPQPPTTQQQIRPSPPGGPNVNLLPDSRGGLKQRPLVNFSHGSVGSNASGSTGSLGPQNSNGTGSTSGGANIIRRDLQQFIDKLTKESNEAPHVTLPRLLAGFLPKVGLDNVDGGDSSGSHTLAESNVFLSTNKGESALTPFVSHMTFSSVANSETGEGGDFQPVSLEGALLFIDISGYSKICAALQGQGAHAISDAVNSYMERILSIVVGDYHGDVLKFAGDAVMVTWTYEADMERSSLSAASCAMKLQAECGEHPVESDNADEKLSFRIHIGLTAGTFHSDVFQPKFSAAMQKAYHFVHGPAFNAIEHIVDAAKSGEVCCCQNFKEMTEGSLETIKVTDVEAEGQETWGVFRVESITPQGKEQLAVLEMDSDGDLIPDRPRGTEAQFIHPSIVKKFEFGINASHLAEMRLLCVLFIHKTNKDATVADWFYESQEILDAQRCPIVQIIEDDKGVHLVAAVNLFVAESNPTMVGLSAARALMEREVECTIGMATGVTFCGIVGSSKACRWDITGSACVRAARLMQFANNNPKAKGAKTIIDSSLVERCTDFTQLREVANDVQLKGTADPITVFTLSDSTNAVTARISRGEGLFEKVLPNTVQQMVCSVSPCVEKLNRGIGVITGPIGSGKKSTAVRCGSHFGCPAILHPTTRGAAGLSVAGTLADWYEHHADPEVSDCSRRLQSSFNQHILSRTMHLALELVALTLAKGVSTCFIVHHAQFLDSYSLSLLHKIHSSLLKSEGDGRWLTILTHYPLYGAPTALKLAQSVSRSTKCSSDDVPIVTMEDYTMVHNEEQFNEGLYIWKPGGMQSHKDRAGGNIGFNTAIGYYMGKAYFDNIAKAKATGKPVVEFSKVDIFGRGEILHQGAEVINTTPWPKISPDVVSRITQQYDVLPPRHQMVLKVLAAVTRQNPIFQAPISMVEQITLQLVSKRSAKEIGHDIKLLDELLILSLDINQHLVSFRNPAMRDMVDSLLTPEQGETINKRCAQLHQVPPFYKEDDPMFLLTLARFLRHGSGVKPFLVLSTTSRQQYLDFLNKAWSLEKPRIEENVDHMDSAAQYSAYIGCKFSKELNYELHHVEGLGSLEAIGVSEETAAKFKIWFGSDEVNAPMYAQGPSIDPIIVNVRNYQAPLSLGPLGHVLPAIAVGLMTRYFDANRAEAGEAERTGLRKNGNTYRDISQRSLELVSVYMAGLKRFEEIVPSADSLPPKPPSSGGGGSPASPRSSSSVTSSVVNTPVDSPLNCGAVTEKLTLVAAAELRELLAKERQLLESMLGPDQTAAQYVKHAKFFLSDYAVNTVKPRAERAARWLSSAQVHLPPPPLSEKEGALEDQQRMMRRAFDCLTVQVKIGGSEKAGASFHRTSSSSLKSQTFATKLELDESKFHDSLMCLAVEHWTPILPAILANAPLPEGSHVKDVPVAVKELLHFMGMNMLLSKLEMIRDGYIKNKDITLEQYRAFLYLYCVM